MAAGREHGHLVTAVGIHGAGRGQHHGHAVVGEPAEQSQHLCGLCRVKARRGVVKEKLFRPAEEFGGDGGSLAFARVEVANRNASVSRQINLPERVLKVAIAVIPRGNNAPQLGRVAERTPKRQDGVNRLPNGDISDLPPRGGTILASGGLILALGKPEDRARGRGKQPG